MTKQGPIHQLRNLSAESPLGLKAQTFCPTLRGSGFLRFSFRTLNSWECKSFRIFESFYPIQKCEQKIHLRLQIHGGQLLVVMGEEAADQKAAQKGNAPIHQGQNVVSLGQWVKARPSSYHCVHPGSFA